MWLWGEPLRRGFIRSLHLGVLGTVVMVFLGFAAAALEPTERMGPVVGTAVVLFFALLTLCGSVALFNRPPMGRTTSRPQRAGSGARVAGTAA